MSNSSNIKLSDNSNKIMKLMAEHRYITNKEMDIIFKVVRTRIRIINKLKNDLKYIDSFATNVNCSKAYYLTKKGYDYLGKNNMLRVKFRFKKDKYSTQSYYHNVKLIEVRLALENHPGFIDFQTACVIFSRYDNNKPTLLPDGELLFVNVLEQRAGIELELNRKSIGRYKEKLYKFDNRNDLNNIIWIYTSASIYSRISSTVSKNLYSFRRPGIHYFVTLDSILESGALTKMINYKGETCGIL